MSHMHSQHPLLLFFFLSLLLYFAEKAPQREKQVPQKLKDTPNIINKCKLFIPQNFINQKQNVLRCAELKIPNTMPQVSCTFNLTFYHNIYAYIPVLSTRAILQYM